MKFAIINDTHIGPENVGYKNGVQRKLMGETKSLVQDFVIKMNLQEKPEFVINLGDSIEDVNDKTIDIDSYQKTIHLLSTLKMPVYYLIGNHDIRTLTKEEIAQLLGYQQMNYSFDHDNFHFIALSFDMTEDHTHDLSAISAKVPDWQLDWLANDLSKTSKQTIVLIHYGLAEDDLKGNFWFETEPHHALLENRNQVKKILTESGKVIAVISGHQHWNRMHVENGIPYFVVTSMAENFNNDGVPANAYSIVELNANQITVKVKGNDPAVFKFGY